MRKTEKLWVTEKGIYNNSENIKFQKLHINHVPYRGSFVLQPNLLFRPPTKEYKSEWQMSLFCKLHVCLCMYV